MANWLISQTTGVHLHDYGCTLKAYRAELVKELRLYGEMHRFIPALGQWGAHSRIVCPALAQAPWAIEVRDYTDRARTAGSDNGEVLSHIFDQAAAIFRFDWFGHIRGGHGNVFVSCKPQNLLG